MASFSATEAIGSGFRLIKREPKAILIWIAAYAVFAVVVYGLILAVMPETLGVYQSLGRSALEGVEPDGVQAMAIASEMFALAPVLIILSLVAYSVMLGAIYRALLHPDDSRFGFLRLGRQELWLLVTMVVWCILMLVIYLALVIVVAFIASLAGVLSGAAGADNLTGLLIPFFVTILLGALVMLGIMMRLSLALPMSHEQRRFVIFDSWRITRGHSLKMLGVGVGIVLTLWVIELSVVAIVLGAIVASTGGLEAFAAAPSGALGERLFFWIPVFAIIAAVFGVLLFVITAAPIANIYRQLTVVDTVAAG